MEVESGQLATFPSALGTVPLPVPSRTLPKKNTQAGQISAKQEQDGIWAG